MIKFSNSSSPKLTKRVTRLRIKRTNIFTVAESCLYATELDEKLSLTARAWQDKLAHELDFSAAEPVRPAAEARFPSALRLSPPRAMPRRGLHTQAGRAAFFHALAHIEMMAVYLAWDIIYRFRGLPQAFYLDWLQVAAEEAEHFCLLRGLLRECGMDYGDLPAHPGLWEHALGTADDVLARLAVIPRCMEARGLDVTPAMIEKLNESGDDAGVKVLTRIYQDEIGHVRIGSYWFLLFCRRQGLRPEQHYTALVLDHFKGIPKGPFNREARIIAGFSEFELNWLETSAHE